MKAVKNSQIGKVNVSYLNKKPDNSYSEREKSESHAEDVLLKLFSNKDPSAGKNKILANSPSWPLFYHLSPQRGNIVSWYNFKPGATVLEVGAGCGSITEELVKKNISVTALELTEKRSLINANRNRNSNNLEVVIGNLQEYQTEKQFDYIVCIGVLEYAGSFVDGKSNEPYINFLKLLKQLLKPSGVLLLAIENRLGLKYWSGAPEDHTGKAFDGLNGYPNHKKVQTFGKQELEKLLTASGFKTPDFYYPFPDYKMPSIIYSDNYLPGKDCEFPLGLLSRFYLNRARADLFSEQSAMVFIERNDLFGQLANSFLVAAE